MKRRKDITFKSQMTTLIGVFVVALVLAEVTQNSIYHNFAWVIWGMSFLLHPVWPKAVDQADHRVLEIFCRIAGAIVVVIGMTTSFVV